MSVTPVVMWARAAQSLGFCVISWPSLFVLLSFFDNCAVCPSIFDFFDYISYLQTFLIVPSLNILDFCNSICIFLCSILSPLFFFFCIFYSPFYRLSFNFTIWITFLTFLISYRLPRRGYNYSYR